MRLGSKVNAGSPAEKAGLRAGDAVISIGGQNAIEMRHKECQDAIIHSGNAISMEVQRGGLASLRPPGAAQQQPVPKNVDTADGSVKALVHNQFNSPMPLYSEEKIAETLSAQTEVLAGGALGVDFKKNEKKYDGNMSEVLKMVQDMDQNPQSHAEPPEEAVDSAPLDPDYSGLNSIKSRSMRSLMVKPDGHGAPQTSVHAPRIVPQQQTKVPPPVAPKPAAPMSPQPAPMAPQAAPANRGPPGMRSFAVKDVLVE
ncbi:PDZ and LIM domain protein Zasp [Amphibalanus amphitrite]|uniref:PDZ and LIM domain protein Zasp n=1 Tax=Amphibalanus amphitrite TaxID=1232801 RepID=A0A6A4W7J2_AMPAM|nr:PDZ and LIM domain protein Zasp [Amphibalanus amphitrite]